MEPSWLTAVELRARVVEIMLALAETQARVAELFGRTDDLVEPERRAP